ncbi:hypothetical protein ACRBEV_22515 [Methylobacterium phyllosphaerae]
MTPYSAGMTDNIAASPAEVPLNTASDPIFSLADRMSAFRSLGGNCEFGFVQRYAEAEPSGLLRFSYTPISDLVHALDTDFRAYGAPGDLRIETTENNYYYCASQRYNIWSNTAHAVGSIDPGELLSRQYDRIAHLKRRMLEDLAAGTKILVRKTGQGETDADFARLAMALTRHGASVLLRVEEAGPAWRSEPVRKVGDRMFVGHVRRFAPQETAWDVDLEPWIRLCDSAYATIFDVPEAKFYPEACADPMRFPERLRQHRGRTSEAALTSFTRAVAAESFSPDHTYVFSSWVWIPSTSAPERILAVLGHDRLRSEDADLTIRDRWQRVWAAGRFRHGIGPAAVGLGMIGAKRDRFWASRPRLYQGPVPRADMPPAPLGTGLAHWIRQLGR